MTISASQGVGSISQGSYAPTQEQVVPTPEASISKEPEITSAAKLGTSSEDAKDGGSGEASKEAIKKAIADINKRANGTEAVFGIHEKTNRVTIKIVDKESKEVIKEVPAEKTLDLIAKVWEMAGIMVDEKR